MESLAVPPPNKTSTRLLAALLVGGLALAPLSADDNVEWAGVSHVPFLDRRPLCPVDREAFSVVFQAYRLDLTSARVRFDDGTVNWIDAQWAYDRGPYAVWQADLPAAAARRPNYYFELTDGTDTDYLSVSGMSENPPIDGGFVLDFNTLEHAPLGATQVTGGGTVFKVWAPNPTSAFVRGQFNAWGLGDPMSRAGEFFIARIPNAGDRQMYKYFFEPGAVWKPDARARALNPAENYNSFVEDPFRHTWRDSEFQTPAFEDLIIYELHVGTFAGRNDPKGSGRVPATYADLAAHVDHLVELGVNAVELLPVTEFPWDFSAGYNPVTAWAPEWKYGSPDELKTMIDVLHQSGIAVLLDIVWNHFSPTDNYLWFYDGRQIYFDDPAVNTPWGSQPDFDRPQVREYFLHSTLHWLDEFHLDGFRMDATSFMSPFQAGGWSLMQEFNDLIDNRRLDKIAIAEQLPDDPWVTRPTNLGGAGFDSQWYDAFVDDLRQEILDAAFGDPEMWKLRDIINGSGQYLAGRYVTNYFELHDEAWGSNGGGRMVKTIDTSFPHDDLWAKGRTKLAQGLVMFAPGIPTILQGTEWLEDTPFGGGGPGSEVRIDWSKKTRYANIFRYYRDIIAARKSNAALRADSPREVFHLNESGNVIGFHRWNLTGNDLIVIANFSNTNYADYRIGLPQPGTWYELINSQSARYDGNGQTNPGAIQTDPVPWNGYLQSAAIRLPQMGLLLLRFNDPPCPADLNNDGVVDLADLGILLSDFGCTPPATCPGDIDNDGDTDLADLGILLSAFGQTCR